MCENKAKNAFQVGEFNEFFREHDVLEQFLRILGVEIEEEKYSCISQFTGEFKFCWPCRSYKIYIQSV